ncbi:uncharacterized protein LOC135815087 isoform X3 [Sycon ciliatum]|uniref:uncharacterized protein LOC135815087 isoform X3 n=1 Tax=Sycon ciliatum TaxID=27933 RepID=UPI0031F65207
MASIPSTNSRPLLFLVLAIAVAYSAALPSRERVPSINDGDGDDTYHKRAVDPADLPEDDEDSWIASSGEGHVISAEKENIRHAEESRGAAEEARRQDSPTTEATRGWQIFSLHTTAALHIDDQQDGLRAFNPGDWVTYSLHAISASPTTKAAATHMPEHTVGGEGGPGGDSVDNGGLTKRSLSAMIFVCNAIQLASEYH